MSVHQFLRVGVDSRSQNKAVEKALGRLPVMAEKANRVL